MGIAAGFASCAQLACVLLLPNAVSVYINRILFALALAASSCPSSSARADETFPRLKIGTDVYTNVVITEVTVTDIYFSYAGGIGNAKLKNLDPELQRHFQFNPARARQVESNRLQANARFRDELAKQKPRPRPPEIEPDPAPKDDSDDLVVPVIHAKSFRGKIPPPIAVEQWLTPAPDPAGKFILVDFFATWCGPCRASIPHLNRLQAKFKDRLVVVGLSRESLADLRKMTSPRIDYAVASDRQAHTMNAVGVTGIPHALLIDPNGIVRFEGMPNYLTEDVLARLLDKYGPE